MRRTAPKSDHKAKDNQAHNNTDFDTRKPKFEFTKEPDTEVVDSDDKDQKCRYPDTRIDFFTRNPVPSRLAYAGIIDCGHTG